MQRFFVPFPLTIDLKLTDKDLIHQISHVMRMQVQESIVLFDGDGTETEYQITSFSKQVIELRWQKKSIPHTESKREITLYQAIPNKYEKIEYIIEKGVEIGIRRFIFFRSDRSQKLIISEAKIRRFHMIAKEALEQCGGVLFPEIYFLEKFESSYIEGKPFVLDTTFQKWTAEEHPKNITLCVGPEGGWSPREIEEMKINGFTFVHFWNRILRTETAWIVGAFAFTQGIL